MVGASRFERPTTRTIYWHPTILFYCVYNTQFTLILPYFFIFLRQNRDIGGDIIFVATLAVRDDDH